jgi:hypothetical protein
MKAKRDGPLREAPAGRRRDLSSGVALSAAPAGAANARHDHRRFARPAVLLPWRMRLRPGLETRRTRGTAPPPPTPTPTPIGQATPTQPLHLGPEPQARESEALLGAGCVAPPARGGLPLGGTVAWKTGRFDGPVMIPRGVRDALAALDPRDRAAAAALWRGGCTAPLARLLPRGPDEPAAAALLRVLSSAAQVLAEPNRTPRLLHAERAALLARQAEALTPSAPLPPPPGGAALSMAELQALMQASMQATMTLSQQASAAFDDCHRGPPLIAKALLLTLERLDPALAVQLEAIASVTSAEELRATLAVVASALKEHPRLGRALAGMPERMAALAAPQPDTARGEALLAEMIATGARLAGPALVDKLRRLATLDAELGPGGADAHLMKLLRFAAATTHQQVTALLELDGAAGFALTAHERALLERNGPAGARALAIDLAALGRLAERDALRRDALADMQALRGALIEQSPLDAQTAAVLVRSVDLAGLAEAGPPLEKKLLELARLTGGRGFDLLDSVTKSGRRGSYARGHIDLGSDLLPRTLAHEFGHALEHEVPGVKAAAQAFVRARRTSDEAVPLRALLAEGSYDDGERAFPGRALHPYVLKEYPDATEVVSTGLERFSSPAAMLDFATADLDHFLLILGALRPDAKQPLVPDVRMLGR